MLFDKQLRDRWNFEDDHWTVEIPEGFSQGRAVFGGLTAALAAALSRSVIEDPARDLRTMSIAMMRPAAPGAVRGEVLLMREGRSASFVEVKLFQDERLIATSTFVYCADREETTDVDGDGLWDGPGPEELGSLPYIEGMMPEFLQNVDMRWASGVPPYQDGDEAEFTGYCRFTETMGDVEGIIALLDVWPCPTLSLLDKFAVASTVTWTAHIVELPTTYDDFFGFRYETVAGRGGFHTVQGELHGPNGKLVAYTEQLVAVYG